MKKINTKDKLLELTLFDEGFIEIESKLHEGIGIDIKRVDSSKDYLAPKGALYLIRTYVPEEKSKTFPFEFESAYILSDGTMVKCGDEYTRVMSSQH
jgi:hypothetical protein